MKKTLLFLVGCFAMLATSFGQITNTNAAGAGAWLAWQGAAAPAATWMNQCNGAAGGFGPASMATHCQLQESTLNPNYGLAAVPMPNPAFCPAGTGNTTNYIWGPNLVNNANNNSTAYFELCFNVDNLNGCNQFNFQGNADDQFTLWVNGNLVQTNTGWNNTMNVNITPLLNCGANWISVMAQENLGNWSPRFFIGDVTQTFGLNPTVTATAQTNCGTNVLQLSATGTPGVTYAWTGPNGWTSTQQNPVINNAGNAQDGQYCVTVTSNAGACCTATSCITVDVPEDCCDEIDFNTNFSIEKGCLDVEVTDLSTVTGGTINPPVIWNFGDSPTNVLAAPGATVNHTYASPGTYTICLIIQVFPNDSTCCHDTLCMDVKVSEGCDGIPDPTFDVTTKVPCFPGSSCCVGTFFNNTVLFDPSSVTWSWGDGSFSSGVAPNWGGYHIYGSSGTYVITMTAIYHPPCNPELCCIKTFKRKVRVWCGDIKDDPIEDVKLKHSGHIDEAVEMNAYPNPVQQGAQVTLEIPEGLDVNTVMLYNTMGQVVLQQPVNGQQRVSLEIANDLAKGLYIIRSDSEELTPVKLFITD